MDFFEKNFKKKVFFFKKTVDKGKIMSYNVVKE